MIKQLKNKNDWDLCSLDILILVSIDYGDMQPILHKHQKRDA